MLGLELVGIALVVGSQVGSGILFVRHSVFGALDHLFC